VQDVINIGPDGAFVAVAIGYGFEEDRRRPIKLEVPRAQPAVIRAFNPAQLTLGLLPVDALLHGFRLSPPFVRQLSLSQPPAAVGQSPLDFPLADDALGAVLERVKPAEDISFLFSMIDTSSGRELQDEPTHNLASLGKSNGERPFRVLARPLYLGPRASLRLQVVERSEGVRGTLFIVLIGYRVYQPTSCPPTDPTELLRRSPRGGARFTAPTTRALPFDYAATFNLQGIPGNQLEDEIVLNSDGAFIATSVGYGLAASDQSVPLSVAYLERLEDVRRKAGDPPIFFLDKASKAVQFKDKPTFVNLRTLPLGTFSIDALRDGVRIRPALVRMAFQEGGQLSQAFPLHLIGLSPVPEWISKEKQLSVFERLNRPDEVQFRYSFFDTGRGRDLQNQPLLNVAGLGIANGDRPFKQLARPLVFPPRSTIRLRVEEVTGRGTLYIVFQGHKRFGQAGGRSP
jgi:hypothetical protein